LLPSGAEELGRGAACYNKDQMAAVPLNAKPLLLRYTWLELGLFFLPGPTTVW